MSVSASVSAGVSARGGPGGDVFAIAVGVVVVIIIFSWPSSQSSLGGRIEGAVLFVGAVVEKPRSFLLPCCVAVRESGSAVVCPVQ